MQKELEQKHSDLLEKNKILAQLAITDPLTGLLNKGYLMKRLKSEVARSSRYNETISCMMVDVDFFKRINDSHGHLVGDTVLKHIARIIKDATRATDIVTRYGGEEFFVICPNSTLDGVLNLAERVRYNVENTPFVIDQNTTLSLTVSVGVKCAIFDPSVDTEIASSTLIHDADLSLYKAKSSGRNRVEIS
jgi:diguanylate cyclase (GGDEF)-like protein